MAGFVLVSSARRCCGGSLDLTWLPCWRPQERHLHCKGVVRLQSVSHRSPPRVSMFMFELLSMGRTTVTSSLSISRHSGIYCLRRAVWSYSLIRNKPES